MVRRSSVSDEGHIRLYVDDVLVLLKNWLFVHPRVSESGTTMGIAQRHRSSQVFLADRRLAATRPCFPSRGWSTRRSQRQPQSQHELPQMRKRELPCPQRAMHLWLAQIVHRRACEIAGCWVIGCPVTPRPRKAPRDTAWRDDETVGSFTGSTSGETSYYVVQ